MLLDVNFTMGQNVRDRIGEEGGGSLPRGYRKHLYPMATSRHQMWMLPDSLAGYASSTFNMSTKHWPNTGWPLGEHNLLSWHGAMKSPGIITIPLLS